MSKQTKSYDVIAPGTIRVSVGEKAERTLRAANLDADYHALDVAAKQLGGTLVAMAGKLRLQGVACPSCRALTVTSTGESAIAAGRANYPQRPHRFGCEACADVHGTISELLAAFSKDWRAHLERLRKIRSTTPQEFFWTIARQGGATSMRTTTRAAIDAVLPKSHDGMVELCKVIAFDESSALALVQDSKLPTVTVPIDAYGRPLEHWHALKPTVDEENELAEAQRERRAAMEKQLDAELQQERSRRLAAAGF